ncbi:hypothetical protein K523DRAFT_43422 [Schizophyllum commune Tattone D]|nr:hypothetical protein K523DRAFT_43422 [Schizophyllum commune Tattone D]
MFPILARYGAYFLLSKSQGRCQLPEEAQVTAFGYFSPGLSSPSRLVDRGSCGLQSRRLSCGRPRGIFCLVFYAPRGDLRRARILSGTQVPIREVTDWHFEGPPLRHASLVASSPGRIVRRRTYGWQSHEGYVPELRLLFSRNHRADSAYCSSKLHCSHLVSIDATIVARVATRHRVDGAGSRKAGIPPTAPSSWCLCCAR